MLDLVNLPRLMALTQGRPDISITLIDGPVNTGLSNFQTSTIKIISPDGEGECSHPNTFACEHGTLVAGVLLGKRGSTATAICPGCTLLLRPIFGQTSVDPFSVPTASPEVLAKAITESVLAGTKIINLSCGIARCSGRGASSLRLAISFAASKGVLVVAAAGNHSRVGGSCVTRNAWVIPVVAIDGSGKPANECNLSATIGLRGLAAPGQDLPSVHCNGAPAHFSGTSAACPVVAGTAALLWSEYPNCTAAEIKEALTGGSRQRSLVPPAMDAWGAFQKLAARAKRRKTA